MNEKATMYILKKYEEKLLEYMTKKDYTEFSAQVAKEAFRIEVEDMVEGPFKNFVRENFERITR